FYATYPRENTIDTRALDDALPMSPKAESTCHFGAGLNKSGPGPLSFIGYLWLPCAGRRHSRRCLAFDFKCDFVKTLRAQDIEHANDIAVHGVPIPPHEHLRVRVFLMNFSQYGG